MASVPEAIGGWKVGAALPGATPTCAALPLTGLLPSGSVLRGPQWRSRGIEVEVALRLGRDLVASEAPSRQQMLEAVAAVLPAMEVVETARVERLGHGALVLGEPSAVAAADIDLREVTAYLAFDGQPVASARGAHTHGDLWALLAWLAVHCTRSGTPLRAGQVVTTGSCSGLLFAAEGTHVQGELQGIGRVELRF
jgi:2-keto-4-pentenoate hydratase